MSGLGTGTKTVYPKYKALGRRRQIVAAVGRRGVVRQ
jgi:hypothetical protein